jgi:hypothetical protein
LFGKATSVSDELNNSKSFEHNFLSKKESFSKPKQKHFQIKKHTSKIEWNMKYAFPKSKEQSLFEYKAALPSKIDLLNKHLEKKIMIK